MNYVKTGLLLAALTTLFVWIGGYFGGQSGATFALIFALMMSRNLVNIPILTPPSDVYSAVFGKLIEHLSCQK